MSESIKDIVTEDVLAQPNLDDISDDYVLSTICMSFSNGESTPITGIAKAITWDDKVEISSKVNLNDAMDVLGVWKSSNIDFVSLRLADNEITLEGPLEIESLKISDIDPKERMAIVTMVLNGKKNVI